MKYRIIVAAIVLLSHTSLFPHSDPFPIKSLQEGFLTSGTAISDFRRVTPFDSVDCPLQNYVQLGNDGKQLHLHWIAEINEKSSTGIYTAPDTWSGADYLRLQIITDVKNYYSYCYYFFPLGNLYDAIRRPDFIIDESWNSNYSYTSSTDDNQWIIEAVIPYSDLRFFGSPPYHWKIILTRYFKASDETYSVPVVHTRLGKDYFRKALPVVIKEKIRGAKPLFIRPYALTTYDRQRQEFIFKEDDVGIDISCWLSQATDVKFSFKPDFSDIPLDDELDIYNLKFAPSYDENRYFFIEDMDVFGLDYNTFYSRHVLQPEYGFKIISNNDRFSWGILSTKESSDEVDHRDFFNILACNPTSEFYSLPVIILNRTDGKYHNDVLIFSPDCEIAKNHFLKLDLRLSTLHDSASDHVGYNFEIGYNLLSRYLNLTLETRHMSRDFRLDMGRIYEDDFYGWTAKIERNIEFNKRFLREIRSSLWLNEEIDNSSNDLLERFMFSELELELQKKVSFLVEYQYVRELFQDKYYIKSRAGLRWHWEGLNWAKIYLGYNLLQSLIYSLQQEQRGIYYQLGFKGDVSRFLTYEIKADRIEYRDLPGDNEMDDKYWLINCDLTLNPWNTLALSTGVRYNDYQQHDIRYHTGFYCNLRWQITNMDIFTGFRTSRNQIRENSMVEFEYFYWKLSYTF